VSVAAAAAVTLVAAVVKAAAVHAAAPAEATQVAGDWSRSQGLRETQHRWRAELQSQSSRAS
jgi:hypothetical protein